MAYPGALSNYSQLGPFNVGIHAANTVALGLLEEDEALVAPTSAPRVLDLPVVLVAIGILELTTRVVCAGVPPLGDCASAINGIYGFVVRIVVRIVGIAIVITFIGVADKDDGMVKASATAVTGI